MYALNYYSNTILFKTFFFKSVGHNLCHVRGNCINWKRFVVVAFVVFNAGIS